MSALPQNLGGSIFLQMTVYNLEVSVVIWPIQCFFINFFKTRLTFCVDACFCVLHRLDLNTIVPKLKRHYHFQEMLLMLCFIALIIRGSLDVIEESLLSWYVGYIQSWSWPNQNTFARDGDFKTVNPF